jgi:hypothetical protein
MHSKSVEDYKKRLKLTKFQREILVGLLLGDARLETQNRGRTYRLKVEYSTSQTRYLQWLWQIFKNWVRTPPQEKIKKSPSGKAIKSIYFNTYAHGSLRFYAQQFYSNDGRKIIPKIIKKLLTPLNIAIWFMDDGSWKSRYHRTYIVHTDGYSKKDLRIIQIALKEKFNIETSLHRQYKNWRVYIKTSSGEKFRNLIKPYVLASMKYKLGNTMPKE